MSVGEGADFSAWNEVAIDPGAADLAVKMAHPFLFDAPTKPNCLILSTHLLLTNVAFLILLLGPRDGIQIRAIDQ